jgi:hypothetical protein
MGKIRENAYKEKSEVQENNASNMAIKLFMSLPYFDMSRTESGLLLPYLSLLVVRNNDLVNRPDFPSIRRNWRRRHDALSLADGRVEGCVGTRELEGVVSVCYSQHVSAF